MRVIDVDGGYAGTAFVPETELEHWWLRTAANDLQSAAPKIEEYGGADGGSADLEVMGDALAVFSGFGPAVEQADAARNQEMACWFYALGKIARLISDYRAGRPGKPDTWHDTTVYSMMARRLQEVGRWP